MVARFLTLKLTLMGNTFRKSVWQTIGMIVAALYALGVVGALVILVGALAYVGDPAWAGLAITLGGALTVVGWWIIPIFAFGVDATLDPHRFTTYAIPRRTLLAGLAVAGLVSVPVSPRCSSPSERRSPGCWSRACWWSLSQAPCSGSRHA
jgi:ABC-2 type transport system permease protein